MAEEIKIPCKVIFPGEVDSTALVTQKNFAFFANVDPHTGICNDTHFPELLGESVVGKVMVFKASKSSTGNFTFMYTMALRGIAPAALITCKLDPIQVMGNICGEIPLFQVDLEKYDPTELIAKGDRVVITGGTRCGDAGEITIYKE